MQKIDTDIHMYRTIRQVGLISNYVPTDEKKYLTSTSVEYIYLLAICMSSMFFSKIQSYKIMYVGPSVPIYWLLTRQPIRKSVADSQYLTEGKLPAI